MLLAPHFCPTCCSQQPPLINRSEREKKSVPRAASWRRKPLPSGEGCFCENTLAFWQLLRFRGALVLREVRSCLGIGAAGEEIMETSAGGAQRSAVRGALGSWGTEGLCLRTSRGGIVMLAPPRTPLCPQALERSQPRLISALSLSHLRSALPEKPLPFQYPPGWPPPQELPPSLQAPPPGGWPLPPDLQWG